MTSLKHMHSNALGLNYVLNFSNKNKKKKRIFHINKLQKRLRLLTICIVAMSNAFGQQEWRFASECSAYLNISREIRSKDRSSHLNARL